MKVLFICKGNWFRSQMAAAIYNKLTDSNDADSVGTYVGAVDEPEGQTLSDLPINPALFELMEKNGMDIRSNQTKRLTEEMLEDYDTVVSMAEDPFIPDFLKNNKKVILWNVSNSNNTDKLVARETYDQLYKLVSGLINS